LKGIFMKLKAISFVLLSIMLFPFSAWADLSKTEVSQLYVSIFGRASEGEGNAYWKAHSDMTNAANSMLDTQAAKDYFGANLNTNQAFIEHIYLNTLNKTIADDVDGINYWVSMLNAGTTRGEAVATLVGAINDYAPDGPYYDPDDAATVAAYNQFSNRVTVSDYMADTVYDTPDDWATSTSFNNGLIVTDNAATITEAKRAVDRFKFVPPAIELNRTAVDLEIGESTTITISGGSGNFSVANSNTQVASAWITGNNLGITGLSGGTITLVVTDAEGMSADVTATVNAFNPSAGTCGAYVAPGVWKEFDCYNLAAIGKNTGDDPFTPTWRLIGGYWQWGRKGPDESQWHYMNSPYFAHGPTGPGESEANSDEISFWNDTDCAPDGDWSEAIKTENDPCPAGFRVPTVSQWQGVIDNNTQSTVGTWEEDGNNYSSGRFFGTDLMLPAAGYRSPFDGESIGGVSGAYWSSSESGSDSKLIWLGSYDIGSAWNLSFGSTRARMEDDNPVWQDRLVGSSIRCVAE
jgi:hypothetical protein